MSGFDCEFTEEPPKWLQCYCPICLLILREPYQVTCCGKSYCRDCIQKIEAKCPSCKNENFDSFPNKGLQLPLYGLKVFCSYQREGCGWQGELGHLMQHLRSNGPMGCLFIELTCKFCNQKIRRGLLSDHETYKCLKRPFTCTMCKEYWSVYEDVASNHAPECKCRLVECPNSCGTRNLQFQHLEKHIFSTCPLMQVKCDFKDVGCNAEVNRKDLLSHLNDEIVPHTSLLAKKLWICHEGQEAENKKLQNKLAEQSTELEKLKAENNVLRLQVEELTHKMMQCFRVPPIDFLLKNFSSMREDHAIRTFNPFYAKPGGCCLQLSVQIPQDAVCLDVSYELIQGEFHLEHPCTLHITTLVVDQFCRSSPREQVSMITTHIEAPNKVTVRLDDIKNFVKNNSLLLRVSKIEFF